MYTECYVYHIRKENILNLSFKKIAIETRRDKILSKLSQAIQEGSVSSLTDLEFNAFKNKSNELSVEYDCVMWGYRVIIPSKLQEDVLKELHASHLGIVKTKALARSYVWWRKIDSDIERLIKGCISCQELQVTPEKSPLIPWIPSNNVWSRIHIDFAGPIKDYYLLVIIDSFSKWVEVFKTKQITSSFTISKIRELFCRYGIVDTLVTDNGRQFTSQDFRNFLKINNVNHILTSPGHPATNGQAEIFVKTLKKCIMANLKDGQTDFDLILERFLCDYRNTQHCTTGESPAKIFFGRSLKTRFSILRPPLVRNKIIKSQNRATQNYKGRRNVNFSEGDKVFIRDYKNPNKPSWMSATVKNKLGPRSYSCIIHHNNREIKRHVDQIRSQHINCELTDEPTENNNEYESISHDIENNEQATICVAGVPKLANLSNAIKGCTDLNENIIHINKNEKVLRKLRSRIAGKVVNVEQPVDKN